MVDRTVTVRLRLDSTQWAAGQSNAVAANNRLAASAQTAATGAQQAADRTAAAVAGTFRAMAAQGTTALGALDAAANRSSQALASSVTAAARSTATAATAASRTTAQASTAAATSTRQISTAAGQIPAAFRSATAAATGSLGQLDAAAAAARAQTASAAVAGRQAMTSSAATASAASAGIRSVTASGVAGANSLSLAARLNLAQAAAASQATAATATAAATRVSTAAHLTAAGATNAAAGAAAATARADANAAALSGTFASATARARTMGSAVVTAASNGEKALKAARVGSLALVAAFGLAVYANSRFETAMSGVKAATQGTTRELSQLRQAAIQAGSSTQFSATQAADAETELAKAGVSTNDILGGALKGTLNLAAAGQMSVADSAVVAAKDMNSFGLAGSDMAHIADVIAAAAGKSATDVHGMSLAMAQSALLAHQTGLSLEQTAGALALFAQNGLEGSDAGTSLKTMLMRLTPQSAEARAEMQKLGFSAYDSSGQFIGWSATAQALQDSLKNLTPQARNAALGVIFGSDAIRAATIVSQAGAKGVDQWTKAANDQGYAARYAATQTDNLSGDLRRLKSALETALIQSGSAANGVLRDMAKSLTDVVRWYSGLPPTLQKSVTALSGIVGVVGLIASGLLLMLPRIAKTGDALKALGVTAAGTKTALSGLGRMTLVVGALTAITMAADKLTAAIRGPGPDVSVLTDQLTNLATSGKATGDSVKELDGFGDAVARIAHPSTLNRVDDVASSIGHLGLTGSKVGSYTDAKNKINALDESLAQMVQSGSADLASKAFDKMATEATKSGTSTDKLRGMLPKYKDALASTDAQQKMTTNSSKGLGDQATTTADDLQDTRTEVEKLTDALDALDGNNISAAQSAIQFQQSMADFKTTVKQSGTSMDITTDKGRKVKSAFLDMADAAMKSAEDVAQQTNSQAAGNKVLAQNVDALKKQMLQLGFSKSTVDKLLASYAQVPSTVTTKVVAQTDTAAADLDAIRKKLADIPAGKSITVKAPSAAAIADLKAVGYKVTTLPNHQIKITVPTSSQAAALDRLRAKIDALTNKTVTLTIRQQVTAGKMSSQAAKNAIDTSGNGNLFRRYADGGTEQHVAQIAPAGAWRLWAEPETGGEAYIPLAPSKRARSRAIADQTVRMLGGKGVAWANGGVARYASGGFTYSPSDPTVTLGANAGMDRYTSAVSKVNAAGKTLAAALADAAKKAAAVRDAEKNLSRVRSGHHTAAQLAAAEEKLTKARTASTAAAKKVTADRKTLNAADSALGVKAGTKSVAGFNLPAYEKQLAAANKANAAWEANLAKIGAKAGTDVEDTLRGMGTDGTALVAALAKASGKTFTQIVAQLKALAPTAQATLKDYTAQLNAANKQSAAFQANLLKLAGMGDTALASQLAAQGDDAAAAIAAAAVKSSSAASTANAAAATNAGMLTADDLAAAVTLLGVLKAHPGAGIADVIAAGLDWSTVRALAPKISSQIKAVSGSATFVDQMRGQGVAMARGGILTRPTAVVAAEAGHTESWIPWDGSARSSALLSATAAAMGYQLVPAGRYAGAGGAGGPSTTTNTTHHEWHLHGAHQSLAEQKADLVRQMNFVG